MPAAFRGGSSAPQWHHAPTTAATRCPLCPTWIPQPRCPIPFPNPGWEHAGGEAEELCRLQQGFFWLVNSVRTDGPTDKLSFTGQQNVAFQVIPFLASGLFLPHVTQVRLVELSTRPSPHSHLIKLLGTSPSHSILLSVHPIPVPPGPGAVTHQCRTRGLCHLTLAGKGSWLAAALRHTGRTLEQGRS